MHETHLLLTIGLTAEIEILCYCLKNNISVQLYTFVQEWRILVTGNDDIRRLSVFILKLNGAIFAINFI